MFAIKLVHKIISCGCETESPRSGDSNTYSQHLILWRNTENFHVLSL